MPDAVEELDAGDLVFVDFSPVKGSEQDGYRPALVLSSRVFHTANNKAIVCPITRNMRPWPTKVPLPDGLPVAGCVLVDQIRAVDRRTRGFRPIGRAPQTVIAEVRLKVALILGIGEDGHGLDLEP